MSNIDNMHYYASLTHTWYINQHCMRRCPAAIDCFTLLLTQHLAAVSCYIGPSMPSGICMEIHTKIAQKRKKKQSRDEGIPGQTHVYLAERVKGASGRRHTCKATHGAWAHPDQGQDQAPGTRPAGEDEASSISQTFTWRGQGNGPSAPCTGSRSSPSGPCTWRGNGPSDRFTGRGSGPSGLYTWRRLGGRRSSSPSGQVQAGQQHQQPYQGQQTSQGSQPGKQCYCCQGFGHKSWDLPPTTSVRAVLGQPLQSGLHRRTRWGYTACVLVQRLQGDRTWPTFQVLPCQACPYLRAVQTPWEGSTARASHGQGHPVYASAIASTSRRWCRSLHRWDLWRHGSHAACVPRPCQHYRRYSAVLYTFTWGIQKLQPEDSTPRPVCWISTGYWRRHPRCSSPLHAVHRRARHHWQGTLGTSQDRGSPQPMWTQDRDPLIPYTPEACLGDRLRCPGAPPPQPSPALYHQWAPEDVQFPSSATSASKTASGSSTPSHASSPATSVHCDAYHRRRSHPEHQPAAMPQLTSASASLHDCELSALYVPSVLGCLAFFLAYLFFS